LGYLKVSIISKIKLEKIEADLLTKFGILKTKMTVKQSYSGMPGVYFCTFTCYHWLNLFEITSFYNEIYKWFQLLTTKNISINGFVIMPNHLHTLMHCPESNSNINKLIGNGKRFMAYKIIEILKAQNKYSILKLLENGVSLYEKKKGKLHQVFQPSFDCKKIDSIDFGFQKLDYIHNNPVKGKWNLANDCLNYQHSSARFYELGTLDEFSFLSNLSDFL